jgi:hypothetical protein
MTLAEFLASHNLADVPADAFECAWFARCTLAATHYESHPALKWVPACDRCVTFVND